MSEYQAHCSANFGPEDIPRYETCGTCRGAGYSNHPDSGEICETCGGSGGVERIRSVNMVTYNIITFGYGLYGVDIGTLGDTPAVFIIPNGKAGPVGEKIPLELQGPLELDKLPNDWTVLTFPTRERCKEVADALVGSKMGKWSRDQASQKSIPCDGRPSTESMCDLISAIIQDEASYDPAANKWDTSKAAAAIVSAFDGA